MTFERSYLLILADLLGPIFCPLLTHVRFEENEVFEELVNLVVESTDLLAIDVSLNRELCLGDHRHACRAVSRFDLHLDGLVSVFHCE